MKEKRKNKLKGKTAMSCTESLKKVGFGQSNLY